MINKVMLFCNMDLTHKSMFKKVLNAWNSRDPAHFLKIVSDYVVYEHAGSDYMILRGKEELKSYLMNLWKAIPNLTFDFFNSAWNEPVFFVEWNADGNLIGKRYEIVGNYTPIKFSGVAVIILDKDGIILEQRTYFNDVEIIKQVRDVANTYLPHF